MEHRGTQTVLRPWNTVDFDRTLCVINVLNIERKLCGKILKCRAAVWNSVKMFGRKQEKINVCKMWFSNRFSIIGNFKTNNKALKGTFECTFISGIAVQIQNGRCLQLNA